MAEPASSRTVPASIAVAELLDKYDHDQIGIFITHLDVNSVSTKVCFFLGMLFTVMLAVAIPLWGILSSRSTLYFVLYMALDNFISLPTSRSISWWAMFKGFFIYWWCCRYWKTVQMFVLGQVIPRLRFGFRPKEIIIRKPKNDLLQSWPQNDFVRVVSRAINPDFLATKTGVQTEIDFWVVDTEASAEATERMRKGEIDESTWKTSLWRRGPRGGWEAIECWRQYELCANHPDLIGAVKAKIVAVGGPEMFDEWLSQIKPIVESMGTNGEGTVSKLAETSREFFSRRGIDYDKLSEECIQELSNSGTS